MNFKTKIIKPLESRGSRSAALLIQVNNVLKDFTKYKRLIEARRALDELKISLTVRVDTYFPKISIFKWENGRMFEISIYPKDQPYGSPADLIKLIEAEIPRYYESDEISEPGLYQARREIQNAFEDEMTASQFLNKRKAYAQALRELADEVAKAQVEK